MAKNSMTAEVDPEIAAAEARLKEAEAARAEAYRIADDPGQLIGTGRWRRLPLVEPEATRLKSDANHAVRQAQRPKLSVIEARERLAAEEKGLAEAWERLGQIQADASSSDASAQLRAIDADATGAAKAVRRAEIAVEAARQMLKDAEQRDRGQRLPLFEVRARAIARRIDEKLDALAEIVAEAVELGEQAHAAGVSFESPIFPGAAPAAVSFWRERQRKLGRLA